MSPVMLRPDSVGSRHGAAAGRSAAALALGTLLVVGCQHEVVSAFPAGLDPLEDNTAELPKGTADDPYPESLVLIEGESSAFAFVHASAYVRAPIARTWQAFQQPAVVVDANGVSEWSAIEDVEEGYDVSFRTHYVIRDVVTVEFDLTWRESAVEGSLSAPERVAIKYQKTSGSSFVRSMVGYIELRAVEDDVTSLSFVQHLDAVQTSSSDISSWTRDLYANVLAYVEGAAP